MVKDEEMDKLDDEIDELDDDLDFDDEELTAPAGSPSEAPDTSDLEDYDDSDAVVTASREDSLKCPYCEEEVTPGAVLAVEGGLTTMFGCPHCKKILGVGE